MRNVAMWIIRLMSLECLCTSIAWFYAGNIRGGIYWMAAAVLNTVAGSI